MWMPGFLDPGKLSYQYLYLCCLVQNFFPGEYSESELSIPIDCLGFPVFMQ